MLCSALSQLLCSALCSHSGSHSCGILWLERLLENNALAAHAMKDQIVAIVLIFGTVALCNVASLAVVQLMQNAGVIA